MVLSVRDPDAWFDSVQATIAPFLNARGTHPSPHVNAIAEMAHETIEVQIFDDRMSERDHATRVFREHIAEVQSTIPADRLLTFDLRDGWPPLCEFLEVEVPEIPFPKTNSSKELLSRLLAQELPKPVSRDESVARRLLKAELMRRFCRFKAVDVCHACNNVDTTAKKIVGAPWWFSFSPRGIRNVIQPPVPYASLHVIDRNRLRVVWDQVSSEIEDLEDGSHRQSGRIGQSTQPAGSFRGDPLTPPYRPAHALSLVADDPLPASRLGLQNPLSLTSQHHLPPGDLGSNQEPAG